jgi:hypothetical protein
MCCPAAAVEIAQAGKDREDRKATDLNSAIVRQARMEESEQARDPAGDDALGDDLQR